MNGLVGLGGRIGRGATDLAGRAAVTGVDALLGWRYTDELVRCVLDSPAATRAVAHALEGPAVDRVVDGPEVERLAVRLIESRLLDTVVERLLESEDLWLLVDEIAHSPPVTDAIGRQSIGFAEQVAGEVRARSGRADAGLERVARRLLRRESPEP